MLKLMLYISRQCNCCCCKPHSGIGQRCTEQQDHTLLAGAHHHHWTLHALLSPVSSHLAGSFGGRSWVWPQEPKERIIQELRQGQDGPRRTVPLLHLLSAGTCMQQTAPHGCGDATQPVLSRQTQFLHAWQPCGITTYLGSDVEGAQAVRAPAARIRQRPHERGLVWKILLSRCR